MRKRTRKEIEESNKLRNQTIEYRYKTIGFPYLKYNYYNIYLDSTPELSIWIYCIDISIIRNPCRFEYIYNNEVHIYEPDFMINGLLVEIKGDQFIDKDTGKWYMPYTKLHHNSKPLTKEEKEYYNGLYEAKHQCKDII